jgi:homoserine O-succinyltransferase
MLIESRSLDSSQTENLDGYFDRKNLAFESGGLQVDIGLVNNMPDAALRQTERQFRALLEKGAGERLCVRMHFLSMAGVLRGAEAQAHMRGRYVDVSNINGLPLDALIVTGAEPRAKCLREEAYWQEFTQLMDWAERNAVSTICSCLAAHAAVLYFDRIERRPIGYKRCGLFESEVEGEHPLSRDLPKRLATPHSRFNEVREEHLRRAGYRILTRSQYAGADMFTKTRGKCAFVYFQGHPEYESCTLLREYRRDVLRYLHREREDYPVMPFKYFAPQMEWRLACFEQRARAMRSADIASELPFTEHETDGEASAPWAAAATLIYRNWLNQVVEAKRRVRVAHSLV